MNKNEEIYFRERIDLKNKEGESWTLIDGKLKYISYGEYGVWGINSSNEI